MLTTDLGTMDFRSFFAPVMEMTRNARTARRGNAAERRMCDQATIKTQLEAYFGSRIVSMRLVPGKKKSDIECVMENQSIVRLQNKNGGGGAAGPNRGWSADRRSVDSMPLEESAKRLLSVVCLKEEGDRPTEVVRPAGLIRELLLGTEVETMPTHFTHTESDPETGEILHLSIASADAVLSALEATAYPHLLPKITCVHIAPGMYLQRKGGGNHDSSPNDIQLKIVEFPAGVMTPLM